MNSSQFFLRGVLNRLVSRFNSQITDIIVKIIILSQEVPEKTLQQWELFCEEVQLEAKRIENAKTIDYSNSDPDYQSRHSPDGETTYNLFMAQTQIDHLRGHVSRLSSQIKEFSP